MLNMLLRSAFCVVRSWNNNGKYMTKNHTFISTDRTFHFVWLPESISKVRKCLFDRISNPLERKLFVYPPPLRKFTSFRPPYPSEFPWPSVGWVWIFSGTTHFFPQFKYMNYHIFTITWAGTVTDISNSTNLRFYTSGMVADHHRNLGHIVKIETLPNFLISQMIGNVYDFQFSLVRKVWDGRGTVKSSIVWDFPYKWKLALKGSQDPVVL